MNKLFQIDQIPCDANLVPQDGEDVNKLHSVITRSI